MPVTPISTLLRRTKRRLLIVGATRRWRPDHIDLALSGNRIYVDTHDPRGWEIVRGLGRGHQPALLGLWRQAIEALAPHVVVDVGANYGELFLSGSYPSARAIAIEPNPTVAARLARSIAAHPDHERMELHELIASDRDGGTAELRIDPRWSGTASLALDGEGLVTVQAPVRTLTSICAEVADGARVLLKIDAEGWEPAVLAGAEEFLRRTGSLVAIIEFEPLHLARSGTDPAQLFARIATLGRCWAVDHPGTMTAVDRPPTQACDLLVISDPSVAGEIVTTPEAGSSG